jgi:hypothetical protein
MGVWRSSGQLLQIKGEGDRSSLGSVERIAKFRKSGNKLIEFPLHGSDSEIIESTTGDDHSRGEVLPFAQSGRHFLEVVKILWSGDGHGNLPGTSVLGRNSLDSQRSLTFPSGRVLFLDVLF